MITSRKTKVLTVLFATLMIFALLTMLPVRTVHADSDPLLYTFNEEDHTAYVNWWANDTNPDVVVPEQVNGYTVTGIG